MSLPVQMHYKNRLTSRAILSGGDCDVEGNPTNYYGSVLCGVVEGDVYVFNTGIPGPFGSEFQFYFPKWNGLSGEGLSCPSELSIPVQDNDLSSCKEYLLGLGLSATNGWGHANSKCFVPTISDDDSKDYLEREF